MYSSGFSTEKKAALSRSRPGSSSSFSSKGKLRRRRRRDRFWRQNRHFAAEMRDECVETAIESLPDRTEAPGAILAIELEKHHSTLASEQGTGEVKAGRGLAVCQNFEAAGRQLAHLPLAIDCQGDGQYLDGCRQGRQVKGEAPGRAEGDAAAGGPGLIEERHVTFIGKLSLSVQPEAGAVHQGAARTEGEFDDEIAPEADSIESGALAALQVLRHGHRDGS